MHQKVYHVSLTIRVRQSRTCPLPQSRIQQRAPENLSVLARQSKRGGEDARLVLSEWVRRIKTIVAKLCDIGHRAVRVRKLHGGMIAPPVLEQPRDQKYAKSARRQPRFLDFAPTRLNND